MHAAHDQNRCLEGPRWQNLHWKPACERSEETRVRDLTTRGGLFDSWATTAKETRNSLSIKKHRGPLMASTVATSTTGLTCWLHGRQGKNDVLTHQTKCHQSFQREMRLSSELRVARSHSPNRFLVDSPRITRNGVDAGLTVSWNVNRKELHSQHATKKPGSLVSRCQERTCRAVELMESNVGFSSQTHNTQEP